MQSLLSELLYVFVTVSNSRSFFSPGDDEAISEGGVHGEHRPRVRFGHHSHQEVIFPHVHIPIDGTRERKVILEGDTTTGTFNDEANSAKTNCLHYISTYQSQSITYQ